MPEKPIIPGGSFLVESVAAGDILIPEELDQTTTALAEAASDFLRGVVLPAADRLQEQEPGLMASLLRQAGELGLMGLEIPERYGGLSLPKSATARIAEALAAEPSFAVSHNVHTSVAALPLVYFGMEEQKQRYLPRLASGDWIGAYALSEAQAGSDALASRCRATPAPDGGYTLSGEKMWITNAAFADLFTVFAKVDGQEKLTAFLVERGLPGVTVGREEHKLGLKGSSTCRLILDSVPVPAANLLGQPGDGGKIALYTLNLGRFKIAAGSLGQAKNLLGIATRYARQRVAFGKPIAEFGLIQQKLARMAARLFACESMLYRLAGYLDSAFIAHASRITHLAAEEYAIECAMLKIACTEALDYCADECLQIHGGYGYTEEFPAARAWRDARVNRIYEGTNEINRLNVAYLLLKRMEEGRIDVTRATRVSDAPRYSIEAMRGAALTAFDAARDTLGPELRTHQQILAALADMANHLFAAESSELRSNRILELGSWHIRWQSASIARWLMRSDGSAAYRELASAIGGDLAGDIDPEMRDLWAEAFDAVGPPAEAQFERERALARAVVDANGYCW